MLHFELDTILTNEYTALKRGGGASFTYLGMAIDHLDNGTVELRGPATIAELASRFE